MICNHPLKRPWPVSLLHLTICKQCRKWRRADRLIAFALACRKADRASYDGLEKTLGALDLPHSMPRPRRAQMRSFVRRTRRPAAIVFGGVAALGFGYTRYIDIDPKVVIPSNVLHGPNAYDDFQRAAGLLREDKMIGEMLTPPKPKSAQTNPSSPGMGMMSGGETGSASAASMGSSPEQRVYTLAEKEDVLKQNADALRTVRLGFTHPYLAPPLRSLEANVRYMSRYRSLSRLLSLESETAAARGDWKRAVASGLDAVELGLKVQYSSTIFGKLTGIACESIGLAAIWKAVPHLSAKDARAAANRLETLTAAKPSTASTMSEEKLFVLSELLEIMHKPGWRTNPGAWSSNIPGPVLFVSLLPYSKARLVRLAEKRLDKVIADAGRPYSRSDDNDETNGSDEPPFIRDLVPTAAGLRFKDGVDDTENGLLAATLALQAYKLEHGTYPAGLGALLDGYLKTVPRDPFSPKNGLRYLLTKVGYTLYGVGPDVMDGGGKSIARKYDGGSTNYTVQQDSSGDIVAGINK